MQSQILEKVERLLNAKTEERCGVEFIEAPERFGEWFESTTGIKPLEVERDFNTIWSGFKADGIKVSLSDGLILFVDFVTGYPYMWKEYRYDIPDEAFAVIFAFNTLMHPIDVCQYRPLTTVKRVALPTREAVELWEQATPLGLRRVLGNMHGA